MAGRPYIGKPFLPKGGKTYVVYDPTVKKVVSLDTSNPNEADKRAAVIRERVKRSGGTPTVSAPKLDYVPNVQETITPEIPSGSSLVSIWANESNQTNGESNQVSQPGVDNQVKLFPETGTPNSNLVAIEKPRKKGGLTPEQAAKLGTGMRKIVTKANVILAEFIVKFLGRDPMPLDDDELEMLATGWEMFLEEFFVKQPPKPWMMILAGNVMIIFAMYVRGTPRLKNPKQQMEAPGHAAV